MELIFMDLETVAIFIATILACMFPAHLINAIRNPDEQKASDSKWLSCILFGIWTFLLLLVINS